MTYVIDGEETPIHFEARRLHREPVQLLSQGTRRKVDSLLVSGPTRIQFRQPPRDRGTSYRDHSDGIAAGRLWSNRRATNTGAYGTFGARTPLRECAHGPRSLCRRACMPSSWNGNDAGQGHQPTPRIRGNMVLEADFDASEISGIVQGLRLQETERCQTTERVCDDGNSSRYLGRPHCRRPLLPPQWTGRDTNAGSAAHASVRGFEGTMLAEFYGPAAEEIGGVLNGTRPAHRRPRPQQHIHREDLRPTGMTRPLPEGDLVGVVGSRQISISPLRRRR